MSLLTMIFETIKPIFEPNFKFTKLFLIRCISFVYILQNNEISGFGISFNILSVLSNNNTSRELWYHENKNK